jgi:hypothetical protein
VKTQKNWTDYPKRAAMSLIETVIEGTLKPDGTLELDAKPNLPAGRVKVVLRQETDVARPAETPFWGRMQEIWAIPVNGGEGTLEDVQQLRTEWDEHQAELERVRP